MRAVFLHDRGLWLLKSYTLTLICAVLCFS